MTEEEERAAEWRRQCAARRAWRETQARVRLAGSPAARAQLERDWEPVRLAQLEARAAGIDPDLEC